MTRIWRAIVGLVVGGALVGLAHVTVGAGQAGVAERLLQEALTKEVVEQNVQAAIRLYEQVLATPGVTSTTANTARRRLEALQRQNAQSERPAAGSSPTPRRVLDGEWTELYDVSADGRLVVGQRRIVVGTQELVVRDLSTGELRVLAVGGGGPEISNDGTLVAYGGGRGGLRIIGTEPGGSPVEIAGQAGTQFRPSDFAPDGRALLVSIVRMNDPATSGMVEFAWVSLADRSVRTIHVFERWALPAGRGDGQASEPEVSPDGRFIAFVGAPAPDTPDRYVYVMDSEGRTMEPVVSTSGQRAGPKWTPDGRHVLFTEQHRNGRGLWSVAIENGRAAGQPKLVYGNIGDDSALLGISKTGVLHYRRNDIGSGRYAGAVSHVVPRTLSTTGSRARPMSFRGCCAEWSPDGQRMAYLADEGRVVIRHEETGEERSYELRGAAGTDLANVRWFPDGSAVLLVGVNEAHTGPADSNAAMNYYRIDLGSGVTSPVLNVGPLRSWNGALSKDGRTLYVATREAPDGPFTQIVGVDIAAGTHTRVATLPADTTSHPQVVVSPDGTTLAIGVLAGRVFQGDGRILTVNVDGTDLRDVGGGGLPGFWGGSPLRWTRDGRSLLFRSYDAGGDWQIMRISASGGIPEFDGVSYQNLSQLVPDIKMVRGNFIGLDVSPDGSRLVVSTVVAPKFEVWALDLPWLARQPG